MGGGSPAPAPPPPAPDYSSQFAGLRSGQDTIRSDIRATEDTFQNEARDLSREITGGFGEMDDRFDDVDTGIRGVQDTVDDGFAGVGTQISGLGTDINNTMKTYGDQMNTGFTGVNENMNTGFGNLSNQVDTRFTELGTGVGNAFDAQNNLLNTGFTGLGDMVTTGNQAILSGQQEGFNSVNDNVTNMGTNLGNQLTETSDNVLTGQANIADLVKQYGGNLDTYYAALAQGQSESAARQAAMQTGLDQFRNDYDKSSTIAQQQRGRIQDAVIGGTNQLQDTISAGADATTQGISNVRADVSGVQSDVQANAAQSTKDFADVARKITVGFDDGTQQSQNMRNEFIDRLDTARSILSDQSMNIDANVRQNFETLVNSFDETGRLITNSTNNNGVQVARAIDQQGNLLLAAFNQAGQRVEDASLNINELMSQMDKFGYVAGSNAMMGQTTGGNAQVYSGLASPYSSTR
jgi:phage-related protein